MCSHKFALKLTTWISEHVKNCHKINRWIIRQAKYKAIHPPYNCNYDGDCGCNDKCFHYDEQPYLIGYRNWKWRNEIH
jgi:hypothetical protein